MPLPAPETRGQRLNQSDTKMTLKKISSIEFGLLSPEVLRKMSTVRVVTADTYDDDGYPIEGGLMDLRLGVIDPGLRCKTCNGRMAACPGHFGHIELVRPVVHFGYVKMIFTLLKATCGKCGRILLEKDKIDRYRALMLKEEKEEDEEHTLDVLEKVKKAAKCPHCGQKQGAVKLAKPTSFFEEDQRLLPSQIRERLERIPEKDLAMLGINSHYARPEWAVLTVLPVPPVTTRPSITLETGERSEDDLTHKIVDILRINQRLADNISAGAPQPIIEDLWELLQYHITTYFNNEASGIPPARHRTGRPLKTLFQRLKGKEGRFRSYLSGKRVNFSARTVISPDPHLSICEVGVPREIAEELTVPVGVTDWNLDLMKEMVKRTEYPTVNYVVRPDGRRKKIAELNREEIVAELAPGYVIERQLQDGDVVIFNRQPSLHRPSMLAHIAKVLPGRTFRMNDAVAPPYNADYDGDEMNLHVPQTEEAKIECELLMKVENHLLSPKSGDPLIYGNLDQISGAFILTSCEASFDREQAAWLAAQAGVKKIPTAGKDGKIPGKELFSLVLPEEFSLTFINGLHKKRGEPLDNIPADALVIIEDGKLKQGAIDQKSLQIITRQIVHTLGTKAACDFINKSTRMSLSAITIKGLTSGISDVTITPATRQQVKDQLDQVFEKIRELSDKYKKGELERMPGKTLRQTLEALIMEKFGTARELCGRIVEKNLTETANYFMVKTGAKGSMINITQMSGCLGQAAVRGQLISRSYRTRPNPYFQPGEFSPQSLGFITSSFHDGLTPAEYFFHAMSGRDSLVDKGINPSKSGYMQRRLITALIDVVLQEDKTVRDSTKTIIQFAYGEDGIDPAKASKAGVVPGKNLSLDEIKKLPIDKQYERLKL